MCVLARHWLSNQEAIPALLQAGVPVSATWGSRPDVHVLETLLKTGLPPPWLDGIVARYGDVLLLKHSLEGWHAFIQRHALDRTNAQAYRRIINGPTVAQAFKHALPTAVAPVHRARL